MYLAGGVSRFVSQLKRERLHTTPPTMRTRRGKRKKEGKGEIVSGGGGGEGAPDRRGRESGKGVIKSKVLSQRGSRYFAVACSAREMTSAKMADLRGAAVLHRCRACMRTPDTHGRSR